MRCHYVYDEKAGKVLIPGCWAVTLSGDIRDCTCCHEITTYNQFEKQRYNQELDKCNEIIRNLKEENDYLHEELSRNIQLIEKLMKDERQE